MFKVFISSLLVIFSTSAAALDIVEGEHFETLPKSLALNEDVIELRNSFKGKEIILTFFSYGCYWCSKFNSPAEIWADELPSDVVYMKVPVVNFNQDYINLGKLFFAIDKMDLEEELSPKIYKDVHFNSLNLANVKQQDLFMRVNNVDLQEFRKIYDGFSVAREIKHARRLSELFNISGTPTLIVITHDHIYATSPAKAKGLKKTLKVAAELISRDHK